tara:strand:- start:433 stop:552 length:120 start_codon:yes stop_codon:yes gene_type:complete
VGEVDDQEFCSSDFDSKDDYNEAIDILEEGGWDCKPGLY